MASTSQNNKYEYSAFISYNREDKSWAKKMQRKIEYYRLPASLRKAHPHLPEKLQRAFRDETELLPGQPLSEAIKQALRESQYLIVICSPNAVKSEWVNKEIEYYISIGREDHILPIIVDGEVNAENSEKECFPPALLVLCKENEILGTNIEDVGGFDACAIRIIAVILNLKFDTLWQRYKRSERLKLRIYFALGLIFVGLLSCLLILQGIYNSKIKSQISISYASQASLLQESGKFSQALDTLQSAIKNGFDSSPEFHHKLYEFANSPFFFRTQILQSNKSDIPYIIGINASNEKIYLTVSGALKYIFTNGCWSKLEDEFSGKAFLDAVNNADDLFIYSELRSNRGIYYDRKTGLKHELDYINSADFITNDTAIIVSKNDVCVLDINGDIIKKWYLPQKDYGTSNGKCRILNNKKNKEVFLYNSKNCLKWNYSNLDIDTVTILRNQNRHIESFDIDTTNGDYMYVIHNTIFWGDKNRTIDSLTLDYEEYGHISSANYFNSSKNILVISNNKYILLKRHDNTKNIVSSIKHDFDADNVNFHLFLDSENNEELIITTGNTVCRLIPNKFASSLKTYKVNDLKIGTIIGNSPIDPYIAIKYNDSIKIYDYLNSKTLYSEVAPHYITNVSFINHDLFSIVTNNKEITIHSLNDNFEYFTVSVNSAITDVVSDRIDKAKYIYLSTDKTLYKINLPTKDIIDTQHTDYKINNIFNIYYNDSPKSKNNQLFILSAEDSLYIYPNLKKSFYKFAPFVQLISGHDTGLPFVIKQIPILSNKEFKGLIYYPTFESIGLNITNFELKSSNVHMNNVKGEQLMFLIPSQNKIRMFNSKSTNGRFYMNENDFTTYIDIPYPDNLSVLEILYKTEDELYVLTPDGIYSIEIPSFETIKEFILSIH